MKTKYFFKSFLFLLLVFFIFDLKAEDSSTKVDIEDEPELIQLYSQDLLNKLITENKHLERVKSDECQFVRDIEDRAMVLKYPSYLYLWADMNFTNTCVKGKKEVGVNAMRIAADKGMPIAMYRLAMFYKDGLYVQKDFDLSYHYLYLSASLGEKKARIELAKFLSSNDSNELDLERSYNWLFFTVFENESEKKTASDLLKNLENKMPESLVKQAKKREYN